MRCYLLLNQKWQPHRAVSIIWLLLYVLMTVTQAQEQHQALATLTAELQASQELSEQRQKEINRLSR